VEQLHNIFYRSFYAMGTRFELLIPAQENDELEKIFQKLRDEVMWWHNRLNRFDPDSDIALINREAARHPVPLDSDVFAILELCDRYHQLTSGLFDPAILPLQVYWHDNQDNTHPEEMEKRAKQCGWKQVVLDRERQTVFFKTKETGFVSGGFGKGYALGIAGKILRESGVENALISFGGSSILALGHHPHGPYWPVGIPDIFNPGQNAYVFRLHDSGLSTSGASQQRTPAGDRQYLHIFNPVTGMPAQGWKTISVEATDPLDAEVMSTVVMYRDKEKRDFLYENFQILQVIKVEYLNQKANVRIFNPPKKDQS